MSETPDLTRSVDDAGGDAPTYFYRIGAALAPEDQFVLPDGWDAHDSIDLPSPDGGHWEIDAEPPGTPLREAREIAVYEYDFRSAEDAERRGAAVMESMRFVCLQQLTGLDFGTTRSDAVTFDNGMQMQGEATTHPNHELGMLGLRVYEDHPEPVFTPRPRAYHTRPAPLASLFSNVARIVDLPLQITERERVSCELLHAARFESGTRTRFLLAVTALEALLEPVERQGVGRQVVDGAIAALQAIDRTELQDDERRSLLGTLRYAQKVSISETGARLAEQLLEGSLFDGYTPRQFFKRVYAVRSELVHNGRLPQTPTRLMRDPAFPDNLEATFERLVLETEWFARRLLLEQVLGRLVGLGAGQERL